MKSFLIALAIIVFSIFLVYPLHGWYELNGNIALTAQNLGSEPGSEEMGFGEPMINLSTTLELADDIKVFAEIHNNYIQNYLPSPPPPADPSQLRDVSEVALREAYISLDNIFANTNLKIGLSELPFGRQYQHRSVNARVESNPLIGNHLTDFGNIEGGLHLAGNRGYFAWNAGLTNGTRDATVEDGTQLAINLGAGFEFGPNSFLKTSWYRVKHDEDAASGSSFFGAEPEPYLLEQTFSNLSFLRDLTFNRVDVLQVDAGFAVGNLNLSAHMGALERHSVYFWDRDYWAVQGDWSYTENTGFAARWSVLDFDHREQRSFTDLRRIQVGTYHQPQDNMLVKVEFVRQDNSQDNEDDFDFKGLVGEVSLKF